MKKCDYLSYLKETGYEMNRITFNRHLKNVEATIDLTYISHRSDRFYTFVEKGANQSKVSNPIPAFINCLITCIWSDGINHTPCIFYTHNPDFSQDTPMSNAQVRKRKRLFELMEYYDIHPNRVKYIKPIEGKASKYMKESMELLNHFFHVYPVPKFTTIFSDEGNCYFSKGRNVLKELGFENHVTYTSSIHQWLSPNDNKLHSSSKSAWSKLIDNFDDDVNSSLFLMHCIDEYTVDNAKTYWENNILNPTESSVLEEISSVKIENQRYRSKCLESFEKFMNKTSDYDEECNM